MAFNHGYSLSCWQSSLQVLLEKKPSAIQISDLHTLGLLGDNFNSATKILMGHHMVYQALQDNLIPPNAMVVSLVSMPSKCPSVAVSWWTSHINATTP